MIAIAIVSVLEGKPETSRAIVPQSADFGCPFGKEARPSFVENILQNRRLAVTLVLETVLRTRMSTWPWQGCPRQRKPPFFNAASADLRSPARPLNGGAWILESYYDDTIGIRTWMLAISSFGNTSLEKRPSRSTCGRCAAEKSIEAVSVARMAGQSKVADFKKMLASNKDPVDQASGEW